MKNESNSNKIESLNRNGAIISKFEITQKEIKKILFHRKKKELREKKEIERKINGEIRAIHGRLKEMGVDYNDHEEVIFQLATLVFDSIEDEGFKYLLKGIKKEFPFMYTSILESYLLGNHDT